MSGVPRNRLLTGDVLKRLETVPDASVDQVVTSPPYFRLRDYRVAGQLGVEDTIQEWVAHQLAVARQVTRVLVPTGSYWLNVGDSYSARASQGAPRKSLLLGPERLALALIREGWTVRNKIVWSKTNHLPSSVKDRLACGWEAVFLLTRSPGYFFDLDAIREPHRSAARHRPPGHQPVRVKRERWRGMNADDTTGLVRMKAAGRIGHVLGKNPGDVWVLPASQYRGAHHATFPLRLADRMIRAGSPEARCTRCLAPWRRPIRRRIIAGVGETALRGALEPGCRCGAASEPGLVLDPFIGSGTTAVAAEALGRDWLGIELNPAFAELARQRIAGARAERTGAP